MNEKSITKPEDYEKHLITLREEFFKSYGRESAEIVCLNDFSQLRTIGTGAFGRVLLVRKISNDKIYAMKAMNKKHIIKSKQIAHVLSEKKLLESINFPFCVKAKYCFQNNSYLYFVMPLINGGEMFTYLRRQQHFGEELSKFYAAQIILALEYLHFLNFVYRDLKPENILIEDTGYLKLIDFGFVKLLTGGRAWTFCGTPEYIAPEIILQKGYGVAIDWWSLGILIYEMNVGYPPFYHEDAMKLYEKILNATPKYPTSFSFDLKDLIKNLLQTDLTRRYGNMKDGVDDIKKHKWFCRINFLEIYNRKMEPPMKPMVKSRSDVDNFDKYDEEYMNISKHDIYESLFKDF